MGRGRLLEIEDDGPGQRRVDGRSRRKEDELSNERNKEAFAVSRSFPCHDKKRIRISERRMHLHSEKI